MPVEQITINDADGAQIGSGATQKIAFYGATPITQPTSSAQAALTLTTATAGGFGFVTSAAFSALTAQVENIRANLVLLGLLKGS
jgi:hypothetical protein